MRGPRVISRRSAAAGVAAAVPAAEATVARTAAKIPAATSDFVDLGCRVLQRGANLINVEFDDLALFAFFVSYDRCLSRPVAMTRMPRPRDSATFSAY